MPKQDDLAPEVDALQERWRAAVNQPIVTEYDETPPEPIPAEILLHENYRWQLMRVVWAMRSIADVASAAASTVTEASPERVSQEDFVRFRHCVIVAGDALLEAYRLAEPLHRERVEEEAQAWQQYRATERARQRTKEALEYGEAIVIGEDGAVRVQTARGLRKLPKAQADAIIEERNALRDKWQGGEFSTPAD